MVLFVLSETRMPRNLHWASGLDDLAVITHCLMIGTMEKRRLLAGRREKLSYDHT